MQLLAHSLWFLALLIFLPIFGSVFLLLLKPLTGGRWLELCAPTLSLLARGWCIAVPVFAGLLLLYPEFAFWPEPEGSKLQELAAKRAAWLNWPGFLARSALVFLYLAWTAEVARRLLPGSLARGGLHLLGLALAIFLFAIDWVMVGDGEWFSSGFPFTFMLLGTASALFLAILRHAPAARPELRRQLSGLVQASIALVAYLAVMEFLIIWMGDLPAEAGYYVRRVATPMRWIPIYVALVGCAFPFISLLSAKRRMDATALRQAAALALSGVIAYLLWLTNPLHF